MTELVPASIPWTGSVITVPGIYSRVSMKAYHSGKLCDAANATSGALRTIWLKSEAHYWCESPLNPNRVEPEETEAFILGRAAHHLLLGEEDFSTEYIVRPAEIDGKPWQGNRTACKEWVSLQKKEGRTVLKPEQLEQIRGMAKALSAHPLINAGILNGAIEQTLAWKCKDTGVWKLARPDAIPNDSGDFFDLKTCMSTTTHALKTAIYERGYHQQGAMVCEGWHALTGIMDTTFNLVFVEKSPPYCVRIIRIPDDDLVRGERQNQMAMERFKKCLDTGVWPGPGDVDGEFMSLPEYAQKVIDAQFEQAEQLNHG